MIGESENGNQRPAEKFPGTQMSDVRIDVPSVGMGDAVMSLSRATLHRRTRHGTHQGGQSSSGARR